MKELRDADTRAKVDLRIVLLGSSPLLVARGFSESLAGRFEVLPMAHWSLSMMSDAFGVDLDDDILFGGYPGAATLLDDFDRWTRYVHDALVETSISRDTLLLTRVDKPALVS